MLLGGRVAEELVLNDITTGASNDIERVTRTARKMVCEWGMSESVGTLAIGENGDEGYAGMDWMKKQNYSEDTARIVDGEIKRIVSEAHQRCTTLLQENMETLHRIAAALLERETISGEDLDLLMENKPLPPLDNGNAEDKPQADKKADQAQEEFTLEPDNTEGKE